MEHEQGIQELGRFARRLAEDIRALMDAVPFGSAMYEGRHDLKRLARPVVAVVGAKGVGKSTLLQALEGAGAVPAAAPAAEPGTSEPPGASRPWEGWEEELSESPSGTGAEVWVLVTSALEPLPLKELKPLQALAGGSPAPGLRVVLTRADELSSDGLPALEGRVRQLLAEVWPGRTVPFSVVSGRTGAGVATLREELLEALFRVQRDRVMEEVAAWGAAVSDLRALLEMRELAAVKPETIDRLETRLKDLLLEEGPRLGRLLHEGAEAFVSDPEAAALPRARRQLTDTLREALWSRIRAGVEGLHPRLNQELAEALREDVGTSTTLALTNRFEAALEEGPRFFDWQSARTVGAVGAAGAALVARLTGRSSGWAVTGGALLGGLLGGLFGKASTVNDSRELRDQVVEPVLRETQERLHKAIESSREDAARLSKLLRHVIQVFAGPEAGTYDVAALQRVVSLAEAGQKQLDAELGRFSQKYEAEALLRKLNLSWPGEANRGEAAPAPSGPLPAGSGQE